jgi:hypothetical protein
MQLYLRAAGIFEGETLHGIRAGGAISAALRGDSLQANLSQAHWSKPLMADRYMRLREVLGQGVLESGGRTGQGEHVEPATYRQLNVLDNFAFVYPWDPTCCPGDQDSDEPPTADDV